MITSISSLQCAKSSWEQVDSGTTKQIAKKKEKKIEKKMIENDSETTKSTS